MSELTLKRAIMLDSGEIIPAGTVLKNYGEFTPKSISPSLTASGKIQFRGKNRLAFKQAGEKNTIFFFRIPRECIDEATLSHGLKKLWVKGSDEISPFFCSVKESRNKSDREIAEIEENYSWSRPLFFDKEFRQIEVVKISSVYSLLWSPFYEMKTVKNVYGNSYHLYTCIGYYYPDTDKIKFDLLRKKSFYVELPSYRGEKFFDDLDRETVDCYEIGGKHKLCQRFYIMEKGDNEWYKQFISAHSWLADINYMPINNDSHIFGKYEYYDGQKNVSGLTIIHKSTNPYLFFKSRKKHMVLIKENSVLY